MGSVGRRPGILSAKHLHLPHRFGKLLFRIQCLVAASGAGPTAGQLQGIEGGTAVALGGFGCVPAGRLPFLRSMGADRRGCTQGACRSLAPAAGFMTAVVAGVSTCGLTAAGLPACLQEAVSGPCSQVRRSVQEGKKAAAAHL